LPPWRHQWREAGLAEASFLLVQQAAIDEGTATSEERRSMELAHVAPPMGLRMDDQAWTTEADRSIATVQAPPRHGRAW
jgi:hypothetical protein